MKLIIDNKIINIEQYQNINPNVVGDTHIINDINNNSNDVNINDKKIEYEEIKPKEEKEEKKEKEEGNEKDDNNNLQEIKNMNNEQRKKISILDNKIVEIMSRIEKINNKFESEKFIGNKEFMKYSQNVEIQLKNYNDKINDIIYKQSQNEETLKQITKINN